MKATPFARLIPAAQLLLLAVLPRAGAIPPSMDRPEAKLTAAGAVILHPGESIRLQFELDGDQLGKATVLPRNSPSLPNTVAISLERAGGKTNYLGTTAIRDTLTVFSALPGKLSVRCTYTDDKTPVPQRVYLQPDAGGLHRAFPKGVTEIVLSEFELRAPKKGEAGGRPGLGLPPRATPKPD